MRKDLFVLKEKFFQIFCFLLLDFEFWIPYLSQIRSVRSFLQESDGFYINSVAENSKFGILCILRHCELTVSHKTEAYLILSIFFLKNKCCFTFFTENIFGPNK